MVHRKERRNLNRATLWSDSQTKDILTSYAEGLACVRFDMRDLYNVRLYKKHQWLVMKKDDVQDNRKSKSKDKSPVKFDRCRFVQIVNGYMTCSCGDTQQYLMPCRHICAVIKEKKYLEASFYNIRWYKTFAYYYLQKFSSEIIPTLNQKIAQIHEVSIKKDFSKINGNYKGVYVVGSKFYEDIDEIYNYTEDDVLRYMILIRNKSLSQAVLRGSLKNTTLPSIQTEQEISGKEDTTTNTSEIEINEFASQSQTEYQFSQQRNEMENIDVDCDKAKHQSTSTFKDAEALFKEVYFDCKTEHQIGELMKCIRNYGNTIQASNKNTLKEISKGGTIMYGTKITKKKKIPRYKSYGEKRLKKKRRTKHNK